MALFSGSVAAKDAPVAATINKAENNTLLGFIKIFLYYIITEFFTFYLLFKTVRMIFP